MLRYSYTAYLVVLYAVWETQEGDKEWTTEIACSGVLQVNEQPKRPWVTWLLIGAEVKLRKDRNFSRWKNQGRAT